MRNKIVKVLLSFGLLISSVHGAVYQWQDANGQIHYEQEPPIDVDSTKINPKVAPSSSAQQERSNVEILINEQKKAYEKELADKKKADSQADEAKLLAINCERAKIYLQNLESKVRIRILDNSQEGTTRLDPSERDLEIKKTKEAVEKYCNPIKPAGS